MTWDEICRNADGAIFGERSLRGLIIGLTGIDVECDECPEDVIEMHCNDMNIWFDSEGRIVNIG